VSGGTFNIGNQQAGAIFQAAGDQTIHHGEGAMSVEALNAVSELRTLVEAGALRSGDKRDALKALDRVETELRDDAPEKSRVADNLQRLARLLDGAGALAGATNALRGLATWLGPLGVGLLRMLT
jgi:hypothetical protein